MHSPTLRRISTTFIVLTLAIAGVVVYFLLGSAEIVITPTVKSVTKSFSLELVPEIDSPTTDKIRGQVWEEEKLTEDTFAVSDLSTEVQSRANGTITIINDRSVAQVLVAHTRFLAPDNTLYRLDGQVVIPGNGSAQGTITADKEGRSGNRLPPLKLTIPGLSEGLQKLVYGVIEEPLTGGVLQQGALSEDDIRRARTILVTQVREQAQIDYLARALQTATNTSVVTPPEIIVSADVLEELASEEIGTVTDSFTLAVSARVIGVSFELSHLAAIAQSKFIAALSEGEEFISIDLSSLGYSLKRIDDTAQTAQIEAHIDGESLITADSDMFSHSNLSGKNADELQAYFAEFPGVSDVEVNFSPAWIKRVPRISNNVTVTVLETN